MFINFDRIHERYGQTDTARRYRPRLCIASRGKKMFTSLARMRSRFQKRYIYSQSFYTPRTYLTTVVNDELFKSHVVITSKIPENINSY